MFLKVFRKKIGKMFGGIDENAYFCRTLQNKDLKTMTNKYYMN